MRVLSLCSGIGGLDLGVKRACPDARTVAYCEADPFCQAVLLARMRDGRLDRAPIWPDIRTLTKENIDWLVSLSDHSLAEEEADRMGAPRKDYGEAVKMYEQGLSVGQVAAFYSIRRQAMYMILKRRGVQFRPQHKFGEENHFHRGGLTVKARANDILEHAIEKGLVVRRVHCETCGSAGKPYKDGRSSIQAHHDDYNKPLAVRWLCQPCHHEWHKHHKPVPYKETFEVARARIDLIHAGYP